jgi:hypothetical protein
VTQVSMDFTFAASQLETKCSELENLFEDIIVAGLAWRKENGITGDVPGEYVGQRQAGERSGLGGVSQSNGDWFFGQWQGNMVPCLIISAPRHRKSPDRSLQPSGRGELHWRVALRLAAVGPD